MARSISVKIPTASLIEQIESRIAEIDKQIEEYPAKRAQYDREVEEYKTQLANFVADYLGKNLDKVGYDYDSVIRISEGYRYNGNNVEVSFDTRAIQGFPKKPEMPQEPNQRESFGRDYTTRKSLLEKNLKILKMTTQEEVSASTYGAVMEIL
jgi:hypothetical protein